MLAVGLALSGAGKAAAQARSGENALAAADDAFGSTVGIEKTGIYNESDVRGFNPVRAGNIRVEGVYFDQQTFIASRARGGSRIRVGIAALDYPFPAPTGIVDFQLRTATPDPSGSIQIGRGQYGGRLFELDLRGPMGKHANITGGVSYMDEKQGDGSRVKNYGVGAVPRIRLHGGDVTLILGHFGTRGSLSRILVQTPAAFLPPMPKPRAYLGQNWAVGTAENTNFGGIWRQNFNDHWSMRSGAFWSRQLRHRSYSEIFVVTDTLGNARHSVVADPAQLTRSYSGEAQLTYRQDSEQLKNRVLFTVRARNKLAESGGSDSRDLGPVKLGDLDPETEPTFNFRPVDQSRVHQVTGALGYMGRWVGLGQLNLGLQKTSYKASFAKLGAAETKTFDSPWLYNATVVLAPGARWLAYASYVRGLEESGAAPENALNRNETLPAARTTQYEAGVRGKIATLTLAASAFQITKPYFSFDAANRFTALGDVSHKGIEASLSGVVGKRLTLLVGGLFMKPVVTGEARTLGRVGPRPVGVAATVARIDAEYRTHFDGLSLTTTVVYTGERAASARPYAELGGKQLTTPAFATVDLGARYRFVLDKHPMSARVSLANIFDKHSWGIAAANSYRLNDTRRLSFYMTADF